MEHARFYLYEGHSCNKVVVVLRLGHIIMYASDLQVKQKGSHFEKFESSVLQTL